MSPGRWRRAKAGGRTPHRTAALVIAALVSGCAAAQGLLPFEPRLTSIETGAGLRMLALSVPIAPATSSIDSPDSRLAKSIASTSARSLAQSGIDVAKRALLECQRGDYPGGGMGILSMPVGRPQTRTDHCFR